MRDRGLSWSESDDLDGGGGGGSAAASTAGASAEVLHRDVGRGWRGAKVGALGVGVEKGKGAEAMAASLAAKGVREEEEERFWIRVAGLVNLMESVDGMEIMVGSWAWRGWGEGLLGFNVVD